MTRARRWLAVHRKLLARGIIGGTALLVVSFDACPGHGLGATTSEQTAVSSAAWDGPFQCPLLGAAASMLAGLPTP